MCFGGPGRWGCNQSGWSRRAEEKKCSTGLTVRTVGEVTGAQWWRKERKTPRTEARWAQRSKLEKDERGRSGWNGTSWAP